MKEYKIEIWGDDALTATLNLSDEEAATVKKVVDALCPTGSFAPYISFVCQTDKKEYEKRKKEEERRRYEEKKERERMEDTRSIWKAAFEKAGMRF